MNRRRSLLAVVFASFLILTCAQSERASSAATEVGVTDTEIVIGSWGPLSGPAALWGSVVRGSEAYFELVNQEGGIHGRKIRFVYRDDGYEPPRTVAAVREMVQREKVFAFVGGVGTAPGMAVREYITSSKIPWVAPASGSTHWAHPPNRYLFSVYPLYADEAAVIVERAVSMGLKKIGVLYQNDDYGKGGLVGAQLAAERAGATIVAALPTEIMDSDLSSHILRLREAGAEAVLLWVLPRQGAIALGTAGNLAFRPQWFASSTLADATMMHEITDGLWSGVIYASLGESLDSGNEKMDRYREAFVRKHPEIRWGAFPSAGFIFAEPLVEALRRAGRDLTREKLVEALESMREFQGIGPAITFGPDQRQGARAVMLLRCISATESETLGSWVRSEVDVAEVLKRMAG
ncbi:MAG TPA: ABC transporter substrate-binding protein [Thermoanaerobaculia bacterium]